jgi:ABC-type polar amino acid transport system ATPase subunit
MGKNGSGKSALLTNFDKAANTFAAGVVVRYITPERGGVLVYDAQVEVNTTNNPSWMKDVRRRNQFGQFKQQSMMLYRRLELLVLREIEKDRSTKIDFESAITQINGLLDNVKLERKASDFRILPTVGTNEIAPGDISSGESEVIGLAIECMTFAWECRNAPLGWLLLDEPDVHLHPDLQLRLARLLIELAKKSTMRVILATHSTPFVAALAEDEDSRVTFITGAKKELEFRSISESMRSILPVFGAHPLSAVFNQQKLLILEGDDDIRIWQRAFRSSQGKINVYPVGTGGTAKLNAAETEASEILDSIYDSAVAYSIRDRDDDPPADLVALGPVKRFRLRCRNAENLLLADETLALLNIDWDALKSRVDDWIIKNATHVHHADMTKFKVDGYPRKDFPIKTIRNDLLAIIGTNKSWEDAVGLAICKVVGVAGAPVDSLRAYLGDGICGALL